MKKTVSVLISIILMLMFCIGLTACGDNGSSNDNNNPSANNPSEDNPSPEPFNVDLAGYVANIGTAKALGISKEVSTSVSSMSTRNTNLGIQLLSYTPLASNKDTEDKNYIVMSTVDYDAKTPEADKTGLTKVTFTKIVTENVTTETTGTKYIIANESSISISATTGFKYTVYYNDSLIYNEVQDNDANDKEPKEGVIVLDNLIDGIEYKVNYKGIGVETTITQDDINGEIDKLCVMNGYTFISFVPVGTSQRPSNIDNIEKDVNGYISYDKENYCSNNSRQSFVIDNATGYVYPIKNVTLQKLHNNLLYINDLVYDYNIDDDNLNFFPLFTNTTIEIHDYMKDKYGNNYVFNDKITSFDDSTNTKYLIFDAKKNYFLSPKNEIVFLMFSSMTLKKLDANGNQVDFMSNENYQLNFKEIDSDYEDWCLSRIENGFAYFYCLEAGQHGATRFRLYDISKNISYERDIGLYNTTSGGWNKNCINATFIDDNHMVFYTDLVDGKGKLYTAKVWGDPTTANKADWSSAFAYTDCMIPGTETSLNKILNASGDLKPVLLLDNCVEENWNNATYSDWRLSVSTLTSTNYYRIAVINGEVCVVNEENYIAPAPQNYTLYPINK